MVLSQIADGVTRSLESVTSGVSEALFEPVIRLGVTGLSRSGKTVFITSLVANLLDRGRMPGLRAVSSGAIRSAVLRPQPDDTIPRFDYETHLSAMTGTAPVWPDSTRTISELRVSLRVQPTGLMGTLSGPRTIHLDIVDYPGEWLLDLSLLDLSYAEWSARALAQAQARADGAVYLTLVEGVDGAAALDEPQAQALAKGFTAYLQAARAAGYSDCTPGRFLLPGDLEGSPVLTFAPLLPAQGARRGSLWREMARRYEAYKTRIVKPFFRDHFAKIDRQIVLVDALGAIHDGPPAVADLRQTLADILTAFRPGRNSWLSEILGKRVERILFAATKADHLHHSQHPQLQAIMEALVRDARDRADFAGAKTDAIVLAALRATVEETVAHKGADLDVVRGRLLDGGKSAAFYPGDLPDDPTRLIAPAQEGATKWLDADYQVMRFAPAPLTLRRGEGPPHIRLDRAAEFLIGDRL